MKRANSSIDLYGPSAPQSPSYSAGGSTSYTPSKKRKLAKDDQKRIGRPKNAWTPTRKRKLVRLYLMTDLNVGAIAKLLWDLPNGDFHPCQRDAQKQLELLIHARPYQVRSRGKNTKIRIKVLREYKLARRAKGNPISFQDELRDSLKNFPGIVESKGHIFGDHKSSDVTNVPSNTVIFSNPLALSDSESLSKYQTPSSCVFTSSHERLDPSQSEPSAMNPDVLSVSASTGHTARSIASLGDIKQHLKIRAGSYMSDVRSLLERLTISECSDTSSIGTRQQPSLLPLHQRLLNPSEIVTPGVFPRYCWEHFNRNQLAPCDDIRMPCNRYPLFQPNGHNTFKLAEEGLLSNIRELAIDKNDLGCLDIFRNSVLHIATAFGAHPKYVTELIAMGANVNAVNNADETFLHLFRCEDRYRVSDIGNMFEALVRNDFTFHKQDHTGRTALHVFMSSRLPLSAIDTAFQILRLHNIDIPTCRDNHGWTIEKLKCRSPLVVNYPVDFALRATQSDDQGKALHHLIDNAVPLNPIDVEEPGRRTSTKIAADFQRYTTHANLLRTIRKAVTDPSCEDLSGRNGLHCLAAVRLDLHVPLDLAHQEHSASRTDINRLEEYLDMLLDIGVNPNAFDNRGYTPLMAFLYDLQDGYDSDLRKRLLERLLRSGANIHSRNRKGETALHVAVKIGCCIATKLLLDAGANCHAQTVDGVGVITLGLQSANIATRNEVQYAGIMTSVCLVANFKAKSYPTILDEWASPELRSLLSTTTLCPPIISAKSLKEASSTRGIETLAKWTQKFFRFQRQ